MSGMTNPLRVQIEVTRHCNLNCRHCMLGGDTKQKNEMAAGDYAALVKQLENAGVFNVNLTGGEFLVHPEIIPILECIFSSDLWVSLQTNATLIDDEIMNIFKKHKTKIRSFAISLYGATAETHEYITRVKGSFEKTIDSIKQLDEEGFKVEIISLMMKSNYHEYEAIKTMCENWDLKHQFNSIIAPSRDRRRKITNLRLSDEELLALPRPWETFMNEFWETEPGDFYPDKSIESWCSMARTTAYIDSCGYVLPCSVIDIPAGNVRETPFEEIWKNSDLFKKIREFKIRDFECSRCENFPACKPCPGLAYLEHGDIFSAPREICRIVSLFIKKQEDKDEG